MPAWERSQLTFSGPYSLSYTSGETVTISPYAGLASYQAVYWGPTRTMSVSASQTAQAEASANAPDSVSGASDRPSSAANRVAMTGGQGILWSAGGLTGILGLLLL